MDAKKIMEALDRELQSHIDRMRQAIAELDKAQPGKVLTDEHYRVEKSSGVYVIIGPDGRWPFHFSDERLARIRASDFNRVHKAAPAELDKPAEPVAWMWRQLMHGYMGGWRFKCETYNPLNNIHVKPEDIEALPPLYTHPPQAAGLTVVEVEQIVLTIERELDHRETIEVEGMERLHIRLTAAIEAKASK